MANATHTDPVALIHAVRDLTLQHREFATSGDQPKERLIGYRVAGQHLTLGMMALRRFVEAPPADLPVSLKASLEVLKTAEGRLAIVNAPLALQMGGDLVVEVTAVDDEPVETGPSHTNIYELIAEVRSLAQKLGVQPLPADEPKRLRLGYMVGETHLTISLTQTRQSLDAPPADWSPEHVALFRESLKTATGRAALVNATTTLGL